MSIIIKSGASTDLAGVDTNNNLKVNLPTTLAQAGYTVLAGERHNGATGAARELKAFRPSIGGRMKSGLDTRYWQDAFNSTVLDTGTYQIITSTMTNGMSAGFLVMNFGNAVAASNVTRIQTYRSFPLLSNGSTVFITRARFAINPATNTVAEMGLGFATGVATPTAGVYFKLISTGDLVGVVNYSGTEVTTSALSAFVANEVREYKIVIDDSSVEFYINDVLEGTIDTGSTNPYPAYFRQLPILLRIYNSGITASAQRLEIAEITVNVEDFDSGRDVAAIQAGQSQGAWNAVRGAAIGLTHNYANSAAPSSATLSNTAAGYALLGGQFQFTAVAGAETDYALFAYQIPAIGTAAGSRNLFIRGITIDVFNMGAASATTPTLLQWAVGLGSTAVSLATTDSNTIGTRLPRRLPLGVQSIPVGTAVGASIPQLSRQFFTPLVVEAGTFFHVILKMPVGTATASQIIRGVVSIDGYYE